MARLSRPRLTRVTFLSRPSIQLSAIRLPGPSREREPVAVCAPDQPTLEWTDWVQRRDKFLEQLTIDFDRDESLCPRLPDWLTLFSLPEQLLLAYERHRETSELGHVFRIANSLHDHLDAITVIGPASSNLAAEAVTSACCDPFHNEMSRAERGSKPRLYFADFEPDNDSIQSLAWRLQRHGYGDVHAERRWGMILIDAPNTRDQWLPLFRYFSTQLDHWTDHLADRPFPLTIITPRPNDWNEGMTGGIAFQTLLQNDELTGHRGILSPSTLLPAAFLGLDVIQLLVGAAAINQNFQKASAADNLVFRWNQACEQRACWLVNESPSFDRLLHWWSQLEWPIANGGVQSMRSCDAGEKLQRGRDPFTSHSNSSPRHVALHLAPGVERTDPIVLKTPVRSESRSTAEPLDRSQKVSDLRSQQREELRERLATVGAEQYQLSLPGIDTHALGQWIQLALLSSAIIAANKHDSKSDDSVPVG